MRSIYYRYKSRYVYIMHTRITWHLHVNRWKFYVHRSKINFLHGILKCKIFKLASSFIEILKIPLNNIFAIRECCIVVSIAWTARFGSGLRSLQPRTSHLYSIVECNEKITRNYTLRSSVYIDHRLYHRILSSRSTSDLKRSVGSQRGWSHPAWSIFKFPQ